MEETRVSLGQNVLGKRLSTGFMLGGERQGEGTKRESQVEGRNRIPADFEGHENMTVSYFG